MSPGYSGKKVGGGGAKVHTMPRARLARLAGLAGAVYSQAQEDADAINAKQSSWTAAVYPQLQRRAWAEVINMRGGERWVSWTPGGGGGGDPSDRVQVRAALLPPAAGQGPAQAAPPQQDRTGEVVFPRPLHQAGHCRRPAPGRGSPPPGTGAAWAGRTTCPRSATRAAAAAATPSPAWACSRPGLIVFHMLLYTIHKYTL